MTAKILVPCLVLVAAMMVCAGQTTKPRSPRPASNHPDLNGIWEAMNEADYDLEAHNARPAMAVRPGPYGQVPPAPVLPLAAVGPSPPTLHHCHVPPLPSNPK